MKCDQNKWHLHLITPQYNASPALTVIVGLNSSVRPFNIFWHHETKWFSRLAVGHK